MVEIIKLTIIISGMLRKILNFQSQVITQYNHQQIVVRDSPVSLTMEQEWHPTLKRLAPRCKKLWHL
jgi:hypothetical protein